MNRNPSRQIRPFRSLKNIGSQLVKSQLFRQNFLYISAIMLLFFFLFALVSYRQSSNTLIREFSASSEHQIEMTAQAVDAHLQDMRYIAATLERNSMVQAFFSYQKPDFLYDEYELRMQELLESYVNSYTSIDSIYLYSELTNSIMTSDASSSNAISLALFRDTNWINFLTEEAMQERMLIFPRAKNDNFPYLLCILKPLTIDGHKAAIVLNLNLSKVSYLTNAGDSPYQEIYLVSDDLQVLYSHHQRALVTSLDAYPKLANLQETLAVYSAVLSDDDGSYVFTQLHSADYPWYYITITNLEAYTDRLSHNNTLLLILFSALFLVVIFIIILFSIRSTKPIHQLLQLIKNPQTQFSGHHNTSSEVQWIAEQIVSYAQQNKALSEELVKRLNLLNETKMLALQSQINPHFLFNSLNVIYTYECEELGYKHELPNLTLGLSKLLQYAFETTDLVALSTELDFAKIYLSLMQQRHNHRFQVVFDLAPDTLNIKVPKLFIQPIAENAIFHGLSNNRKPDGCLRISTHMKNGMCEVTIADNGAGMDAQTLNTLRNIADEQDLTSTGVGFKNVVIRMKLLYGKDFSIAIDSELGTGSTFILRFPALPGQNESDT